MAYRRENAKAGKRPYSGRVEGNLARKPEYERRPARYSERRAEEGTRRLSRRTAVRTRPRQRVSPVALTGFAVLAAMVLVLVMSYARLTELSVSVVSMKEELTALESEHVALLTRYEQVFDPSAIKKAAEETGMTKPSASQILYVDLSKPDSVVLYQRADGNVLDRVFASLGHGMCAVMEYFK